MDTAQVCDRLKGQETCPFHKGQRITTLCKTCGILVCLKCITSFEHEGHTFKEITSCLDEPTDIIAKHIKEIEKRLLIAVEQDLSEMKKQRTLSVEKHNKGCEQIKEQRQLAHNQIDTNADSMVVKWDKHLQQILDILDKHTLELESLQNQLNEERKECSEILGKGSNILKYDAGLEIKNTKKMQRIPKPPNISELDNNFDKLLKEATGILEEVNTKPSVAELPEKSQASSSETELLDRSQALSSSKMKHQYGFIESLSNTNNESPIFAALTPIGENIAWACDDTYDEKSQKFLNTDMLYLIDSRRNVVQQVKLDSNIEYLSIHPITRQLLYISDHFKVRNIDTITGQTTRIVKCPKDITMLKVTNDNHVIVGSRETIKAIYKYKLTGQFVNKSTEKYTAADIDHCPRTNRVAISRGKEGLTLLNSNLTMKTSFNRNNMYCRSAIFDSHGNLIVADYSNKEIIVLDEDLSYIQKLEIDGITCPGKLRLYDNILWVTCIEPDNIICVRIT